MADDIDTFARIAGVDRQHAEGFLESLCKAAASEAMAICLGEVGAASSVSDARALRAYYLARELGRRPTLREVELVFRVPSTTARSILRRMSAIFPAEADTLLTSDVQTLARVTAVGTGKKEQYRITFPDNDPGLLEHAWRLLLRAGAVDCEQEPRAIIVSRKGLDALGVKYKKP